MINQITSRTEEYYSVKFWRAFNEQYKALTAEELIDLYYTIHAKETTICLSIPTDVKGVTN